MMISTILYLLGTIYLPASTRAFLSSRSTHRHFALSQRTLVPSTGYRRPSTTTTSSSTSLFENKLWDRMEIEEDEEKLWYCLNCVAGLEIALLRQCRQRCQDMEDVEKFVVPMVTSVRSHGPNRMVKDTKVKYEGYVFAKLRLCPQTYEAIQGLDLCRSWMGTINIKGHKKLPPSPLCLNEEEIEKFGLEECKVEEDEVEKEEKDGVILDEGDEPEVDPELEETVQNVYMGLRVGDMVKVTAKNKFFNEDAVVRRLKNKQLFLRFYTYGSMYEEWMDPGDVRKLTDEEVLKGLSGPQQPVTQRDIDGPSLGEERERFRDDRSRRNMVSNFGGDQNRRQGRNAERYDRGDPQEMKRNDDNWNSYKDNQRRGQGGYNDGDFEIQGSKPSRDDRWAQSDVDGQWGRTTQRQNRREKQKTPASEGGDWGAFVSAPGAEYQPSQAETDDFFASLMTDLSNDLGSEKKSKRGTKGDSTTSAQLSSEDDFFASLISEIEDIDSAMPEKKFKNDAEDFFASLASEIQDDPPPSSDLTDSEVDFFTVLEQEMESQDNSATLKKEKPVSSRKTSAAVELDSFFSELGVLDDDISASTASGESDDFFAQLEAELEMQLSSGAPDKKIVSDKLPSPASRKVAGPPVDKVGASDLGERTVPELKEMLRERGLKVSGKKAELIERLTSA